MTAPVLAFCEGCEATGVVLSARGFCSECIRAAVRTGHSSLVLADRLSASSIEEGDDGEVEVYVDGRPAGTVIRLVDLGVVRAFRGAEDGVDLPTYVEAVGYVAGVQA